MRAISFAVGLAVTLSACGTVAPLKPTENMGLPARPYGASDRQSTDELLQPSTQAVPNRSKEILTRSEPREIDPFDLPPGSTGIPFPADSSYLSGDENLAAVEPEQTDEMPVEPGENGNAPE